MDPSLQAMLARVQKKAAQSRTAPVIQDEPLDGISCSRCGGTGYVQVTEEDGHVYMAHCPECYSKRMVVRHLRASGISQEDYARYSLKRFDGRRSPEAAQMLSMAVKYLDNYQKDGPGFGVFGKSGNGKTHLCIAVCQEITKRFGEAHYYFPYRSIVPDLVKAAKGYSLDYDDAMEKWKTLPNVYIDDLFKMAGKVDADGHLIELDRDELRIMYDLINSRYINHLKTFFSSEYRLNDIIYVDSALGSRIVEMVKPYGLFVEGKNQRLVG